MTDAPTEADRTIEPYQPFPSFQEFAASATFENKNFEEFSALLERAKAASDADRLRASVDKATKWAAVDTGAIEGLYEVDRGFTLTVATDAAAWETIHLVKGELVERSIKDALEGYEYVMDLATGKQPLTEVWIKQLHEVLCASQETYKVITAVGPQDQPLPKGQYKTQPNNPLNFGSNTVHSYAPVHDVPPEMNRMIQELSSSEFHAASPAIQAAYAHYAFVCIHPFADGNGRVSRALASIYLYRQPGVPLVIFADQKPQYISALELADQGDSTLFVHFIADRAIDTVRMVTTDIERSVSVSQRQARAERMKQALLGKGGLSHPQIDAIAGLVINEFNAALTRSLASNPPAEPIAIELHVYQGLPVQVPSGYRTPPSPVTARISGAAPEPGPANMTLDFGVAIAKPESDGPDFLLMLGPEPVCDIYLRDVNPSVSAALTYQLDSIASEQLWVVEEGVADKSEEALRARGYL